MPKSEVTILAQLRATADLAAAAAMDISRLNERFEAIEGVNDEGSKGTYAASERKHILDRMEVLRSYLSIVPATSALGALAQLSEIDATLDAFFANEHDEYQEAEVARRVRRLVYSIYAFFSQQVAPDELAKAWPIGDYLDPWKPFEQQVTIIEERAESQGQQRAA